jgi:hypothetical protein
VKAPYEDLLKGIIPVWRESAEAFEEAGGELNTPEHRASLRAATDAHLRTVGWTIEEWETETTTRRISAREEMHARIEVLRKQEGGGD